MSFSDPQQNIKHLGLGEGMIVADFGSGAGHYTLEAAARVGEEGKVYAIDIQPDLLLRVQNDARRRGFDNVEIRVGDLEHSGGSGLPDASVNVVFLSNTLFQLADMVNPIVEAWRILKKRGRLMVVDWSDSFGGIGPQPEHLVSKADILTAGKGAGFDLEETFDAGHHHFGLIFRKP